MSILLNTDPWGYFENLYEDEFCKVKRIVVYPKKDYLYNTICIEANIG